MASEESKLYFAKVRLTAVCWGVGKKNLFCNWSMMMLGWRNHRPCSGAKTTAVVVLLQNIMPVNETIPLLEIFAILSGYFFGDDSNKWMMGFPEH
eukprot:scaffold86755_cov56-Attheya_sp.AAC.1